jgi:hypothetical protein
MCLVFMSVCVHDNDLAMQDRQAETDSMHRLAVRIAMLNQPNLRSYNCRLLHEE